MYKKYENLLDAIGNTPLVPIRKLNKKEGVKIFAKLEYFNPGGSVKDRVAHYLVQHGERTGELTKDKIILEATSGNTGIGLGLVAAVKGYRVMVTMPESVSRERGQILKAMGIEILYTPGEKGTDGAIEEAYRIARENPEKYWLADQYNSDSNWMCHYEGTAVELWEQTAGELTMAVCSMGTTGTAMGLSRRLREYNPEIKIIGVEPYLGHNLQGLKNLKESYRPGIFDKAFLDRIIRIEDEEAFQMTRRIAREEGIFAGMSSGAAICGALRMAEEINEGVIAVIFPDGGERYLSTSLFKDKKKTGIRFFNTLTRKKEEFIPLKEDTISIYTCGPTVSKLIDIGIWRRYVVADLMRRYLEFKGYNVLHIMNITDLDDRTIQGSEEAGEDIKKFTRRYYNEFLQDRDRLKIKEATALPLASRQVDNMIEITQRLLEKGFAYERLRSVYFDISRFKEYGKLSKIDLNKIKVGKTVDLDQYEKENPRDFTLFKKSTLTELKRGIYFSTKWGNVRPGWHIQCVAMALGYLKDTFDIHTGSTELVFPHHDNEIAISEALTGKPLANYWMHNELVTDGGTPLREALNKGYTGKEIRYWLLSRHYRKSLDFSWKKLDLAKNTLAGLDRFMQRLDSCGEAPVNPEVEQLIYDLKHKFISSMDDDLNISPALAALFEFIHDINRIMDSKGLNSKDAKKVRDIISGLNSVLMIMDLSRGKAPDEAEKLIREREEARREKDWQKADKIRERLRETGIEVIDLKRGTHWRYTR